MCKDMNAAFDKDLFPFYLLYRFQPEQWLVGVISLLPQKL